MQAQLSVVHQLTGDYRSGFTAICDATIALLIYVVKWAFISYSVYKEIKLLSLMFNLLSYITKIVCMTRLG